MKIAVFASGNGSNFEAIAQEKYKNVEIAILITDNKKSYAVTRSENLNIPYRIFDFKNYPTKEEYEKAILKTLKEKKIDIIILAGYMRIIGDTLLAAYPDKIINIHPSLLPAFKGKNGIKDAYDYGVKIMGVSVHYVNNELDGGRIIDQDCFFVNDMTLAEAEIKTHEIEHRLYPKVIKSLFDK